MAYRPQGSRVVTRERWHVRQDPLEVGTGLRRHRLVQALLQFNLIDPTVGEVPGKSIGHLVALGVADPEVWVGWTSVPCPARWCVSASRHSPSIPGRRHPSVLRFIARGYTYREVGSELHISAKTVESHVSAVLRKLQLSTHHQLTYWATERRLV